MTNNSNTNKILVLVGLTVLTLVLGVVAVVTAMKLKQSATVPVAPNVPQSQPYAQTSEPQCSADIMVVLDRSGSMSINQPSGKDKWTYAKEATNALINALETDYNNAQGTVRVGLASYVMEETPPWSANLNQPLTSDLSQFRSTLNALNVISTMGVPRTCLDCGINEGNEELAAKTRTGVKKYMLFLSDGRGNRVGSESNNVGSVPVPDPYTGAGLTTIQNAAISRVTEGRGQGVEYNVLGFGGSGDPSNGSTVIESTLRAIANDPDTDHYYYAPDPAQWSATFVQILNDMCPPEPPPAVEACIQTFNIPTRTCAESCTVDADCGAVEGTQLRCLSGMCKNPSCATNTTTCICGEAPTCFIQGVKVISPANNKWGNNAPVENQTVTLDDDAAKDSTQPYHFYNLQLSSSHKVSVDVPEGYRVGYSVCYNRIDCHTQAQNLSMVWKDSDTFVCPSVVAAGANQGYVDLWWHFELLPSITPSPTVTPPNTPMPTNSPTPTPTGKPAPTLTPIPPGECSRSCGSSDDCVDGLVCNNGMCLNQACLSETDCVCPTSAPNPTNTPKPSSHGTNIVEPTPPALPTAGVTIPSVGLLSIGGLLLIVGMAIALVW